MILLVFLILIVLSFTIVISFYFEQKNVRVPISNEKLTDDVSVLFVDERKEV